MKFNNNIIIIILILIASLTACNKGEIINNEGIRYKYENIFDISYTPNNEAKASGWFTDAGSWIGFTIPQKEDWVNGFCGPFSLDMNRREWIAKSAISVSFADSENDFFTADSTNYFPGEVFLSASTSKGKISQRLNFIDSSNAILTIEANNNSPLLFTAEEWSDDVSVATNRNTVIVSHPSGETVLLTFDADISLSNVGNNYRALSNVSLNNKHHIIISFFTSEKEVPVGMQRSIHMLNECKKHISQNEIRWNEYLTKVLRHDMNPDYDRIAVKAMTTLMSNWRTRRGGLLHEGIIPSHAVGYFIGFWAWDSWRFSAALAKINPELAKNNIRAMFDYQQPDGMIIDCIYTDPSENNARDSKPPLISWAVNEIFTQNNDTAFVKEMYPQLLSYYKWWYNKRDHDANGMCEYGSTDGTLEAAAWESGMDNAIRFDDATMLKNNPYDDAWSMNQESIDLNSYLAYEARLLKNFSNIIDVEFDSVDYSDQVAENFFDNEHNFFFDKRLSDNSFIREYGCEAYTPLWTQVATPEQVEKMIPILTDTTKFSTYIPFPTIAADNPKYNPKGYWRGPIWLDQTYFAIKGLRNYGYHKLADEYTLQVFDRLQGLKCDAPIHENYGTHTGERLKAPHFSWSASHLIMLYMDYGTT